MTSVRFRLLLADGPRVETFSLPALGQVSIGRGADCDVVIDDARLAEKHALVVVGAQLVLHDLGSAQGCSVGGRRLAANESVAIAPGTVIAVGTATLVVQQGHATSRLRPVRSHAYFEARVEDEQIRAETSHTMFALVRLRCRPNVSTKVETVLAHWLRPMDVVSTLAPDDYELLLVDIAADPAKELCDAIIRDLAGHVVAFMLSSHGAGEELTGSAIHGSSERAQGPFVAVSCAQPEPDLELALFGQERGAFAGALETKLGALEQARGGTLFIDDIGELPLYLQLKLFRALEQKHVLRMGALRPRTIDVRILCATERDLPAEVARGAFHRELFALLASASSVIGPLRDRRDEILALAEAFIDQCCPSGPNRSVPTLTAEAREILESYAWPGNVRELRAVVERAVQASRDGWIGREQLRWLGEREDIVNALAQCAGNQSQAARVLGMSRKTLVKRLDEFSLPRPRKPVR